MRTKLGNCVLFISPVFMGMITILLVLDQAGVAAYMLGAMVLHELGHLVVMWLVKCFPKEIRLLPFEINISADQSCIPRSQQLLVSCGGIVANLVTWILVGNSFGILSLYLALFNGLPLYSMDGYQILSLLFYHHKRVVFWVSAMVTLAVFVAGGWLLAVHKNPMLLLFAVYLLALGFGEKRKYTSG